VRRWVFLPLFLAGCAALYILQRSNASAPITPRPLLYIVADTQREAERIPLALTRVSDQEEIKVGQKIAMDYGLPSQHSDNPDVARISAYLNSVGDKIAEHVQRKAIPYHFYVQDDRNLVNAFALPGGHIVVGRGLLELIESEDELAAVLGHEITHVDNRHAIGSLQYELASRKIGLGEAYQIGRPAVEVFEAGYTKDQELEADRVGLGLAVAAGYSPAGAVALLRRFQQLEPADTQRAASPIEEFAEVPFSALAEYFRSHPPASERRAALEGEISARGWDSSRPLRPLGIRMIFLSDAGERLNRAGNFQTSIERFKEALTLDPTYVRAWRGLAAVSWRSGDARETARAEEEAIRRGAVGLDWPFLARALAASDPKNGLSRLTALEEGAYGNTVYGVPAVNDSFRSAKVNQAGFEFLQGNKNALADFQAILRDAPQTPSIQAAALYVMAWWTYRAGKLDVAEKELQNAHQILPGYGGVDLQLAWVLTDLGRQADAETLVDSPKQIDRAERQALQAVLKWRTEDRQGAALQFEAAARTDPVWMVPGYVENNYSNAAASVIKQLQAGESARRLKEMQERRRRLVQR